MSDAYSLFAGNKAWVARQRAADPDFFSRLEQWHQPRYLWIGCADARVPAHEICGVPAGDMFVHRNLANVVVHSDFNAQAVLQFAVEVLAVEHVIICGHYGCTGVQAALQRLRVGFADHWLSHVRDVAERHRLGLEALPDASMRHDALCELNVLEQVSNVVQSNVVQDAWQRAQPLSVHGWTYRAGDGMLRDLNVSVHGEGELGARVAGALERVFAPEPGKNPTPL